jgi:hypothetical protein
MIIIFMDTVSRKHSQRKLKKTMEFFKKYANYEKDKTLDKKAFEFYRFGAIDDRTKNNMWAYTWNMDAFEARKFYKSYKEPEEKKKGIWSEY